MAVNLSPVYGVAGQLFDNNGNPLAGGKIYTYLAGTTTPAATYTSSSGSIAHSNPIVLDGAGRVPSGEIWLTDGITYKFVVEDSVSNLIGTYDNLTGINSNFVAFTNEQEIQTATAGQTVFNLTTVQYQPGTNSLSVFVDGVNQYGPGAQYAYVETDSDTVTFVSGLHVGASVKFTTSQLNSSGGVDACQVSYTPPFTNAVPTTVCDKLAETISVTDFGAVGDGVTDDTTAFQNAINYLNLAGGGQLNVPMGTYVVGTLTVYSKIWIIGEGREITIIQLKNNTNNDLIYGFNSNALWGSNSDGGIQGFGLFNITLDGNRTNNLTAGSCIAIYGEEMYFSNVFIKNARDYGIRTEWADGASLFGMESYFENVRIDTCGKDGWLCNGPHDSVFTNLIIIDASVNTDKTYSGLYIGPRMNGRFLGCHVWNRAASNRHYAALYIAPNGGGNEFSACHFEGAWAANVIILCQNNTFDDSCHIYAPWNGVNVYLGDVATLNQIRGRLGQPGAGRPNCVGVDFGDSSGDFISDNIIDVIALEQKSGVVNMQFSDGNNRITAKCFQTSGVSIAGTPNPTDIIDIQSNGGTPASVNTINQYKSIPIAGASNATWTFDYPFPSTPYVIFSIQSPSGSVTDGVWISSISASSVTFYNSNAASMTLIANASRVF